MAGEIIAKRHAQAVFQIALERNELERWRTDLEMMASVFSNPDLLSIVENPKVRLEEKKKLATSCLPGASKLALNLAYLLITRGRVRILPQISNEYQRLVDVNEGLEHAEVTTATVMDGETRESVAEQLTRISGKRIVLSAHTDPAIIGGFVARIGDRLIDGSIRSQLDSLRKTLV